VVPIRAAQRELPSAHLWIHEGPPLSIFEPKVSIQRLGEGFWMDGVLMEIRTYSGTAGATILNEFTAQPVSVIGYSGGIRAAIDPPMPRYI
jgi:hypothetical protein